MVAIPRITRSPSTSVRVISAVEQISEAGDLRQSPSLSSDTVVVLNGGLIDAEVDGEVVALSIERGTCYGLNRVGSRVWKLLEKPIRISDLCAALLPEFSVDSDVCESEVLEFLEQLRAEGIISLIPEK